MRWRKANQRTEQESSALTGVCGRFVTPDEREIEDFWHIGRKNWKHAFDGIKQARFNVAPGQRNALKYIPVIRADADGTHRYAMVAAPFLVKRAPH